MIDRCIQAESNKRSLKIMRWPIVVGLIGFLVAGCAEEGPPRLHVAGTANWKDKPIPSGYITFNPDVKKGNSGPQGVAWIKDGQFDTRGGNGRGVSPGDQVVMIFGFDGVNPTEVHPWGKPLFIEHKQFMKIAEPQDELPLTVPASAPQYQDIQ